MPLPFGGRVRAPARPESKTLETGPIADVDQTSVNRSRCGRSQLVLTAPTARPGSVRAGARTLPDRPCKNLFRP